MADADERLPPFPALRAFHAAARLGRFRDAATALGVTESAVSHQIRRLEEFLHVPLFERHGPRVTLTATGTQYFAEIDPALQQIAEATRAVVGPRDRDRVALTLPPSLAMLWLIPNLAKFEAACPDIDLQLVTTTRLVDLRREQVDLAIRHGQGSWPDVEATFLFTDRAIPVCRPGYLDADAGDLAAALASSRLIVNGYRPDEWDEWTRARGLEPLPLDNALRFWAQEHVLAAAEQGLGIAMGRSPLVDERLSSGALVAPFGTSGFASAGYYLCRPPDVTPTVNARRVARWLQAFAEE